MVKYIYYSTSIMYLCKNFNTNIKIYFLENYHKNINQENDFI